MTSDLSEETLDMDNTPENPVFFRLLRALLYYSVRVGIAYFLSTGFWYLTVAANGLARYSLLAETGRNLIFIGIVVFLMVTGELKDD